MAVEILVPKPVTRERLLASYEHPGRPSRSVAGSWIDDFAALKRAILLCPFCVNKFNPRKHHYEVWRTEWYSIARCDDCKQMSRQIRTFIHESYHFETGDWMHDRRAKKGRWGWFHLRSGR